MMATALSRLALKLADQHAEEVFISECYGNGDGWYQIPPPKWRAGETYADLNRCLRYLRARGMLERSPLDKGLWRVVKASR